MKYLKRFEVVFTKKLEIGDYVQMKKSFESDKKYIEFIYNNVGEIVMYNETIDKILVKYENVPKELISHFGTMQINGGDIFNGRWFNIVNIVKYSKNKEEIESEMILRKDTDKYNL